MQEKKLQINEKKFKTQQKLSIKTIVIFRK